MCVVFFNLSNKEFVVKTDNCIAQMIIERCFMPKCVKVSEFNEKKNKKGNFFFFFQLSKKLIEKKMEPHIQVFAFLNKNYIKSEILKVYITNF